MHNNNLKLLLQDDGFPFILNGEVRHIRGTVTIVSADNPASALLGGFKQSASAFRYCRHCTGTDEEIQKKVGINSNWWILYIEAPLGTSHPWGEGGTLLTSIQYK